ncbi:MAG: HEAT repeat domain-containing protein [Elusimicrobiota bacterium]|jgi:hypothetical protein
MTIRKSIVGIGLLILCAGAWGAYLVARQAFLNDFNAGVQGYMAGDLVLARKKLNEALSRRPKSLPVKELLVKVLLEKSLQHRRAGHTTQAEHALDEAMRLAPANGEVQEALRILRIQLARPAVNLPRTTDEFLKTLSMGTRHSAPEREFPLWMEAHRQQEQVDRRDFIGALSQSQDQWQAVLEKQQTQFSRILYGSIAFFALVACLLVLLMVKLLSLLVGRRGLFAQVAAIQEQLSLLHPATQCLSGSGSRAALSESVATFRRLDAVEAELVHTSDVETAHRLLKPYIEGEDLWARARAAKTLYRLDAQASLDVMKALLNDTNPEAWLSAIWGLGELSTREAVEVLIPLIWHPYQPLQQAVIRCLIQIENRKKAEPDVTAKIQTVLAEVRAKTNWVI